MVNAIYIRQQVVPAFLEAWHAPDGIGDYGRGGRSGFLQGA